MLSWMICINFSFFLTGQAHSSVERAGLLGGVKFRLIDPDEDNQLRGDRLASVMEEDSKNGLIPFFVSLSEKSDYYLTCKNCSKMIFQ